MPKLRESAADALRDVLRDGMTLAVGGFGLSGVPVDLINAVRDSGAKELTIVSNNMGVDGKGLGVLIEAGQVAKVVASYVGENRIFAEQFLSGKLEVEFTPQGTLAERLRAGGAGIPAFYTKTGVGTSVAEGKAHAEFEGVTYIQERAIVADLSLVRAHLSDPDGNLVYRRTARNFNPVVAAAGKITVAEVERIVDAGAIDPDHIVTPGVYIQRIVQASNRPKDIEQRTVRPRSASAGVAG
jgi:3-oxoacid CoA-transferase subunit A